MQATAAVYDSTHEVAPMRIAVPYAIGFGVDHAPTQEALKHAAIVTLDRLMHGD